MNVFRRHTWENRSFGLRLQDDKRNCHSEQSEESSQKLHGCVFDTRPFCQYNITVMNKIKKVVSLLLIISVVLVFSGCTTFNNFKYAFFGGSEEKVDETIKIGVYEPMTGKYSKQGKEEIAGIELAHELFPEVLGKKIELIYADNKSDINEAKSTLDTLYAQNPDMVIGSYGEVLTLEASDYSTANSTPLVAVSSVNPLLTRNSDYCFTTTFSEEKQGEALADYAINGIELKKIATVKMYNDDTAQAVIKRFTKSVKSINGNTDAIVASANLENGSTDFTSTITYLKDTGVDCVLLVVNESIAESFLTQCEEQNFTIPYFLGTKQLDTPEFAEFASEHSRFAISYTTEKTVVDTDRFELLHKAYHEKYGEKGDPTAAMALGFDAYTLCYRALEKTGEWINTGEVFDKIPLGNTDAEIKAFNQAVEESKKTGIPSGVILKYGLKSISSFKGASGIISFVTSNEASKTVTIRQYHLGVEMPIYVVE